MTQVAAPCDLFAQAVGQTFVCTPHGEYQRMRTPFLYPDGDNIDLFTKTQGDHVMVITDLGETTRWLRMQTASPRRTSRQQGMIEDISLNHGVEFYKGMLLARCRPGDNFAATVLRVAQAAVRVSDLWFTFRTRSVQSMTDEVAEYLQESSVPFHRGESLVGRSGKTWNIDFHSRLPQRSSLICTLTTGSRSAARHVTEHVLATWYDLNHLTAGPEALRFVSLFDDTSDVWSDDDLRLLEPLSTIALWSKPQEFLETLKAA